MNRTAKQIDAEIQAARYRMKRLRLELRAAKLAETEKHFMQASNCDSPPTPPRRRAGRQGP